MSYFTNLLGYTLIDKSGNKQRTRACLEGSKVVAMYFCSQASFGCRKLTPYLVNLYTNVYKRKGMQIILIPIETSEAVHFSVVAETPFWALPFHETTVRAKLLKHCDVPLDNLPALMLFTPEGEVFNRDAQKIINNPEQFPWLPLTLKQCLDRYYTTPGPQFHAISMGTGMVESINMVEATAIDNKFVGLYFSNHGCGEECHEFVKTLSEVYRRIKSRNPGKFEIIYVSEDKDEEQFRENYKNMPWLALPFEDRDVKDRLRQIFHFVKTIPALVILDRDHKTVVNQNAMQNVIDDIQAYDFPWSPKPVDPFAEDIEPAAPPPADVLAKSGFLMAKAAPPEPPSASAAGKDKEKKAKASNEDSSSDSSDSDSEDVGGVKRTIAEEEAHQAAKKAKKEEKAMEKIKTIREEEEERAARMSKLAGPQDDGIPDITKFIIYNKGIL